jgi:hypothetical protein
VDRTGNAFVTGNLTAGGLATTPLNATNLTSGTVPDARFPVTLPAASGVNLTNLNATNLASGTVADTRLSSNVPLKNAANTFTADQTINTNVKIAGNLAVGGAALGTSNVARTDAANIFAQDQHIDHSSPTLYLNDTTAPANARIFRFSNVNQLLVLDTVDDAISVQQSVPLRISRTGDFQILRDLYEKQRGTPMGHWIDVPFNAANFTGTAGMTWTVASGDVYANRYTLIGHTLIWQFQLNASTIGGTVSPYLTITTPVTSNSYFFNAPTTRLITGGIAERGNIQYGGSNLIQIAKSDSSAFAAGSLSLMFTLIAPIP